MLITGGEPLLQPETTQLIQHLITAQRNVLLETNGSVLIDKVPPQTHIALDIKCPKSKMEAHNNYANLKLLKPTDALKFIVADNDDVDWALNKILEHNICQHCNNIIFSPVAPQFPYNELAEKLLALAQNSTYAQIVPYIRMQLQLHKII